MPLGAGKHVSAGVLVIPSATNEYDLAPERLHDENTFWRLIKSRDSSCGQQGRDAAGDERLARVHGFPTT